MNIEELLEKKFVPGLYDFEVVTLIRDMAQRIKNLEDNVHYATDPDLGEDE